MAILRSNGILEVSSIPAHTPINNQATLARLTDTNTFYYWDGASWITLIIGDDTAYDATSWNGSLDVPTKNAIRDAIEALALGSIPDGDKGDITTSASGATWTIDNGLAATKIADGSVTDAEFQYLGGVTSDIQTQLNSKAVDTEVIHDTGNEVVAGIKTFTDGIETLDDPYDATSWNGNDEVPTKNAIRDKIETLAQYNPLYVFKAIIAQTGTGNPTITTELINSLGETPTISRTGLGDYDVTIVGNLFSLTKTDVRVSLLPGTAAFTHKEGIGASVNEVNILTFNATGVAVDFEGSLLVEIRVYS